MEKMKELYEKVAKDNALQAKFAGIMQDAENAGKEETGKKLIAFAKEEGYELTVDEIRDFFSKLENPAESALSDEELDAVAGGKIAPRPHSLTEWMQDCGFMISGINGFNPQCLKINL